jgi:DNA-binding NarL/FixJ family response regulator
MTMRKINLLLIEDNSHIHKKLYNAATDIETVSTVDVSTNLKDGMDKLTKANYDLVVLDLSLPDGSGLQLLKWINEKQLDIKVLVFSMNIELKKLCLKNGAHAFFDKSKDFDALIDKIFSFSSKDDFSLN